MRCFAFIVLNRDQPMVEPLIFAAQGLSACASALNRCVMAANSETFGGGKRTL